MTHIAFFDTETEPHSGKVIDIGSVKDDGSTFHGASAKKFVHFIEGTQFLCGHNIIQHDLKYLEKEIGSTGVNVIDTLYLSPLLFPARPYHHLVKDDKLQTEEMNNPLNDAVKARDLFHDEVAAFQRLDNQMQEVFYQLLKEQREFQGFFKWIGYRSSRKEPQSLIPQKFANEICRDADLAKMILKRPVELAYALSLIHSFISLKKTYSITPPWVLRNYPGVERILFQLRNRPCLQGCPYCRSALDIHLGLKKWFGFDSYRSYGGEPLQEKAVQAAIDNKSIIAVFPTGGGKSITFQVPALMSGENMMGLTIVISPLQSLMKDQVDNLEKLGITAAVTINGLLDPIERAKSIERVADGSATILYLSPESLRSGTIERLILGRKIVRFVIDEAHCFSSWGQDFRVDYLYIGDFIQSIQEKKNLPDPIPVSCFTATAKRKVIEDIQAYFQEKLSLDLELFTSKASRTNLHYQVFAKGDEEQKYQKVRELMEEKHCPTIIYVSRTHKAFALAKRLTDDGYHALAYHGKMESKEKTANQDAFITGEAEIMVATSAFGMGVDKKDVGRVIHYEISDSLENYIQEAGRAGRDENITADCYVLFNEEDLSKHFILLNQTKLSIKEIQQVWKAIKDITGFRASMSNSALEIARKAGWDDQVMDMETRVTTAIAALEEAGYLRRGQNMPKVFANSILARNAQEAIDKIHASPRFGQKQKEQGVRIIRKLFSSKSRKAGSDDEGESRIDYISDHLGIVKEEVIDIIHLLREENILADSKDLTAFIKQGENKNRSLQIVEAYSRIENFLLPLLDEEEKTLHVKELNEKAEASGCEDVTPYKLKTILNFWAIKHWIRRRTAPLSKNHIVVMQLQPKELLRSKLAKRHELAGFVIDYLFTKAKIAYADEQSTGGELPVEFSVLELKEAFGKRNMLFETGISADDIEDTLFYLSRIEALKIEGGFLVVYNRLTIERVEQDNRKRYKAEDYKNLSQFYEHKVQQIHIVGEYAKKMISDYQDALQFVEDYFQLNYGSFLNKYFKGGRQQEITRNVTPAKFRQLFGELSPTQLKIINDNKTPYIVVAAGPGSGKTRVLVHKLASLLLMEDVKHEQLLMLTFSRAAATEFKKRLLKLIGNAANFIEIKTFHSYCFDLLGRVGSIEKSDEILRITIDKIQKKEVEASRITKTVLVIDEAQDMDENEFELIRTLMQKNEEMRVIAVGDDDQNIYEFRGANSKYFEKFLKTERSAMHELVENYRSKSNLVQFTNRYVQQVRHRLKKTPIIAKQADNGKITIVRYHGNHLITPLVESVLNSEIAGTTCVLTRTNEEALQITGLLLKNGLQAKLIQTNDSFNLYNLAEVRFFLQQLQLAENVYVISDDLWADAKRRLTERFRTSYQLEICTNMIRDFEATHPKIKYKSDLEVFIRESRLEDFFNEDGETIFVSTIHKAKGKEFENVWLMLENYQPATDEAKRLLYVGMTRAKRNLNIHLNTGLFDGISGDGLEFMEDRKKYDPPAELAMQLTHKDLWLDYFIRRQRFVHPLMAGEALVVNDTECLNAKGEGVLKFSQQFVSTVKKMNEKGYHLKSAKVNYMVYWQKEGGKPEVLIVLPEVYFEREAIAL